MVEQLSIVYVHHIFSVHSSVNRHLGCVHVLIIVNSAAVNIGIHVSFWIMIFSGHMPSSGFTGSYGTSILFSIVVVSIDIPTNV